MQLLDQAQSIRDTYHVERFLGEGAFAEVYRVSHRFLGRQAMKVFKRPGMTQVEIECMLEEAALLSRIGHPNIVRVFDANTVETDLGIHGYFTMEYIPGGSLFHFWRSYGAALIPVKTVVEVIRQTCRGLALAHRESPPIVHRDIKPQNILVGYEADGLRVRICDFGLAKTVNPLTLLATSAGTLAFKPPEVFNGRKTDSCAADVWGLGVTIYLLLTDHLPFDIDPELGWSNQRAFECEPPAPSVFNMSVDSQLDQIIARCLSPDPDQRYSTAAELQHVLDGWTPQPDAGKSIEDSVLKSSHSKDTLGVNSPIDDIRGEELAAEAFRKARMEGKVFVAADLMEEAFNKSPQLREKYAEQVRLWRCGVSM